MEKINFTGNKEAPANLSNDNDIVKSLENLQIDTQRAQIISSYLTNIFNTIFNCIL